MNSTHSNQPMHSVNPLSTAEQCLQEAQHHHTSVVESNTQAGEHAKRALHDAIDAGRCLLKAKERLKQWNSKMWMKDILSTLSEETAKCYMRLAQADERGENVVGCETLKEAIRLYGSPKRQSRRKRRKKKAALSPETSSIPPVTIVDMPTEHHDTALGAEIAPSPEQQAMERINGLMEYLSSSNERGPHAEVISKAIAVLIRRHAAYVKCHRSKKRGMDGEFDDAA